MALGVNSSFYPSDEKQTQSVWHKHACHPGNWLAVGGSSGSVLLFLCANGNKMEVANEQESRTFTFHWARCCDAS